MQKKNHSLQTFGMSYKKENLNKMETNNFEKRVLFAFKLGKTKYLEPLINDGLIYMNSVKYFRDLAKIGQGDPFEGAKVIIDGKPVEFRDGIDKEKVFCMWHINNYTEPQGKGVMVDYCSDKMCEISIDTRDYVDEFADGCIDDLSVVVFLNMKEFHRRLRMALQNNNIYHYDVGVIKYYSTNEKHRIEVDNYMKPYTLIHQNEIRYYVYDNNSNPLQLKIGGMGDIAKIFKVGLIKVQVPYEIV